MEICPHSALVQDSGAVLHWCSVAGEVVYGAYGGATDYGGLEPGRHKLQAVPFKISVSSYMI